MSRKTNTVKAKKAKSVGTRKPKSVETRKAKPVAEQERIECIQRIRNGESTNAVASSSKIAESTLRSWVKKGSYDSINTTTINSTQNGIVRNFNVDRQPHTQKRKVVEALMRAALEYVITRTIQHAVNPDGTVARATVEHVKEAVNDLRKTEWTIEFLDIST